LKNTLRSIFYALIDVARYAKITLLETVKTGTTESFSTSRLKNIHLIEALVDGAYLTTLGRAPDAEGRSNFVTALTSGAITPSAMLSELTNSPESVYERLRLDLHADKVRLFERLVEDAYLNILGRAADIEGRNAYVGALMSDSLTPGDMLSELTASPESVYEQHRKRVVDEYRARSISDKVEIYEALVEGIYLRIMGRAPDVIGRNAFVAELVNDRLAPGDIIKELMDSPEYSRHILEEPIIVCTVLDAISAALWKQYINDTDLLDISERVKRGEKFATALSNLDFSSEVSTLALIGLTGRHYNQNEQSGNISAEQASA